MGIKMPFDKAIQIIQDRIRDLNNIPLNSDSWQETTVHDLKDIFSDITKAFSIQNIRFTTPFTEKSAEIFHKGRDTARRILMGYIESIEREREISAKNEKSYEEAYNAIAHNYLQLQKNVEILQSTISLQEKTIQSEKERNDLLSTEINSLHQNTIHFGNVSLKKLLGSFNYVEWAWLIGTIVTIVGISYGAGVFVERHIISKNADKTQNSTNSSHSTSSIGSDSTLGKDSARQTSPKRDSSVIVVKPLK